MRRGQRSRRKAALAVLGVLTLGLAALTAAGPVAAASASSDPNLGPNVMIFDPSMPTSQIQAAVDAVAAQQLGNQFGTQRYALLFKPAPTARTRPR